MHEKKVGRVPERCAEHNSWRSVLHAIQIFFQHFRRVLSSYKASIRVVFHMLFSYPSHILFSRTLSYHKLAQLIFIFQCHKKEILFKNYSTLGVCYRDLKARVYKQETRNLTQHEAQPSAVLNFEFLVCKRVLINPDNTRTKSPANVLIFSLSKPLK